MTSIVYPDGTQTITVAATESIAIRSTGNSTAKVEQLVGYPNLPSTWNLLGNVGNTEVVYGAFSTATDVRISAGIDQVYYVTGATPTTTDLTSGVSTPGTAQANKPLEVDANKDISGIRNLGATNIDAGLSGTAGSVDVFPATASSGKLSILCADQTGDTTVTLSADAMGQATTVHVADPGAAASYVAQSTAALTLAEVDVLDAVTPGTVAASKAVVVDANKDAAGFRAVTVDSGVVPATLAAVNIGPVVTSAGVDISANTSRVAGASVNLKNTANTITGLRGCDFRVNDDGSTGSAPIVGVQGVATKTSGASTSELWGANLIAHATGGKVENAYGVVGSLDSGATSSIGTNGAPINYATAGLFVSHLDTGTTKATEFVDAAVIAKIDQGANNRSKGDAAVMAILGGDNGTTVQCGAAFGVQVHNSTAGNQFDYGLDLYYNDGVAFANAFNVADIRLSGNLNVYSGVAVTRAAVRALLGDTPPQGSLFVGQASVATTKPNLYVKVLNASADTDWERVVTQASD